MKQLYITYASEDAIIAEQIYLALVKDGRKVFFDRPSLKAGDDFDERFREAIAAVDAMIFLISPSSVAEGCFALTEMSYARERWPHPRDRVIPVMVRRTSIDAIPPYLRAVTILEPKGNIPAEVAGAIRARRHVKLGRDPDRLSAFVLYIVLSLLTALSLGTAFSYVYPHVAIKLHLLVVFFLVALLLVSIVRTVWKRLR